MLLDKSVSAEQYLIISKVCSIFSMVLCILAFLCNLISLHIFCKRRFIMPNATRKFMKGLCISEIVYLVLNLLNEIFILSLGKQHYTSEFYLRTAMFVFTPIGTVARKSSFCITFVVCCERYIAISFPLLARTFKFIKHPRILMVILFLIIAGFHSYVFFGYEVKIANATLNEYRIFTSVYQQTNPKLFHVLKMSGNIIFTQIVLIGCFLINILLLIALKRQKVIRRSLNPTIIQEKEHAVTILGSTLLFIFLSLPTYLNSLIDKCVEGYGMFDKEHYLFMAVVKIALVLEIASNVSNFIFYLIRCRMFRVEILYLLKLKKSAKPPLRQSTTASFSSYVSRHM